MDKYEYKLKLEQIRNLVGAKDYRTAARIADSINWRKVKSVSTLCMIGEIYEKTKQLEESREVLLMAYDRSPVGRNIIYRLTLVAVKLGNLDEAQEYYEEFLEVAPHDNMKYVLKYEMAKAKSAPLTEQISILEEFKEREYTEEWAFELAYLYHRNGNSNKCVEICDELILWFGDGRYVEKALELKMLYQPLNKLQEDKYQRFKQKKAIQMGDTVNLQAELSKSMQQILDVSEQMKGKLTEEHRVEVPKQPVKEEAEETAGEKTAETQEEVLLSEEYDGQLSLRMPETPDPVSQITGQMSIEDILAEWEKTREAARAAIAEAEEEPATEPESPGEEVPATEPESPGEEVAATEPESPGEEVAATEPESPEAEEMADEALEQKVIMQQLMEQQELERQIREEEMLQHEVTLEKAPVSEKTLTCFDEEQKEIFTYFSLISGMEQQLCQALEGVYQRKKDMQTSVSGNLVIIGEKGSGKSVLATDFIKAYQKMCGSTGGKVGKITASALKQKDMTKLFEAVKGGYLIIERAGDLPRESVEKISDLMEQNTEGLLVILEDDKSGIEKILNRDADFARKFTERVRIPIFTSDELVVFARAYAREQDCEIEDMGVLALYNSISNIQKLDEATTLTKVKEIMDDAIYNATRGGLKKLFAGSGPQRMAVCSYGKKILIK